MLSPHALKNVAMLDDGVNTVFKQTKITFNWHILITKGWAYKPRQKIAPEYITPELLLTTSL